MRIARTLPPVGYRVGVADIVRALAPAGDAEAALLRDVRQSLRVRHAFSVSSGKAALTIVLTALRTNNGRRKVILPAYTCYSVPSAIVKAGLDPVPCDLAPGSFDYDYAELRTLLGPDVLCALSVHLFGIPSDTRRLTSLCRPMGIYVVEDAAQAMDVPAGERPPGTRADAGIFSLGRGKNVTCGSGGLIVSDSDDIAAAIGGIVNDLPQTGVRDGTASAASLGLLSLFISPRLYWLPAGLPFLKLGETIFHEDFPIRRLSSLQARLLRDFPNRLRRLNAARRDVAAYYVRHIEGARDFAAVPYLRFPLLLTSQAKRLLLNDRRSRTLGISGMYPATVGGIPQLQRRLTEKVFPQAECVAAALVTLPTHELLSRDDMTRIVQLVNGARRGARPSEQGLAGRLSYADDLAEAVDGDLSL